MQPQPPDPAQPPYRKPGGQPDAYWQPPYGRPQQQWSHPPPPAGYYYGQPYYPTYPPFNKQVAWHVVNWIFFWPVALYALLAHFVKIDESLSRGDIPGAQAHAAAVKKLGQIGLAIGIALTALSIAFYAIVLGIALHHINDCATPNNPSYRC